MTGKNESGVSASTLLAETQKYRSSLESLVVVGRALLAAPSMESETADAFQIAVEGVLESADHQDDLIVVDGVSEAESRVELIMQDVLTPRLTEVSKIEEELANKEEDSTPVPFTTRDVETSSSMESIDHQLELLDLFKSHVKLVRMVTSMESIGAEEIRPFVENITAKFAQANVGDIPSFESTDQTHVLGSMNEAVERIEALVERAQAATTEKAEQLRSQAAAIGSDGEDKIGAVIDRHREQNPSGVHYDENVNVNTVGTEEAPTSENGEEMEIIPEANAEEFDEPARPDELGEDEPAQTADAEVDEQPEVPVGGEATEVQEEEEDDDTPSEASIESDSPVVVFESFDSYTDDNKEVVCNCVANLLLLLEEKGMLTQEGIDAKDSIGSGDTPFSSTHVTSHACKVLEQHYETWVSAAVRDKDPGVRGMEILLG